MVLGLSAWVENTLQAMVDTYNQLRNEGVELIDITIEESDSANHERLVRLVVKRNTPEEGYDATTRESD